MNQPAMCPFCGTRNFIKLGFDTDKRISSHVNVEADQDVHLLVFSCESGHLFLTVGETQESLDAISNGRLYERHRNN